MKKLIMLFVACMIAGAAQGCNDEPTSSNSNLKPIIAYDVSNIVVSTDTILNERGAGEKLLEKYLYFSFIPTTTNLNYYLCAKNYTNEELVFSWEINTTLTTQEIIKKVNGNDSVSISCDIDGFIINEPYVIGLKIKREF